LADNHGDTSCDSAVVTVTKGVKASGLRGRWLMIRV
jgi:hypothetical protein